ncbi:type II toxin-antitoxin system CcdA family antitoxin [Parasphingorhabdus halotolerans]|uniref:Type II toxin-antitoxin system CcdA family antitoxin n=1 Tax=Parasphingorhabdus halotolerans TaxID=2725558 RepID=A0A6H2DLM7_9SPHN|nr:type II toxin-antitoxin system CcdA family antitoxin [Parasphingorhabdus halotolerans]QJB69290.1 type II toxin-antitoxin system CcdA family antitoxin [Parasphingorhabdus halotolerans]
MASIAHNRNAKRRPVNLTIREDILSDARALKLNTSKAAEAGIKAAIIEEREKQWLAENQKSIAAHNQRVEESGPLLVPEWADNIGLN